MDSGAATPEEMDMLLEDAFVLRGRSELGALFEEGAIALTTLDREARGRSAITEAMAWLWERDLTYVAETPHVVQVNDLALLVTAAGTHVLRRAPDGTWRSAISIFNIQPGKDNHDHDLR
jgi:hypothetical protein